MMDWGHCLGLTSSPIFQHLTTPSFPPSGLWGRWRSTGHKGTGGAQQGPAKFLHAAGMADGHSARQETCCQLSSAAPMHGGGPPHSLAATPLKLHLQGTQPAQSPREALHGHLGIALLARSEALGAATAVGMGEAQAGQPCHRAMAAGCWECSPQRHERLRLLWGMLGRC